MRRYLVLIGIMLAFVKSNAQFDLARIDVVHIPKGSNQDFEFNRIRGLFNIPIKIRENTHLLLGLDYSVIDVIQIEKLEIDTERLRDFQSFEINLGFTKKLRKNWRIAIALKPGVTTNSVRNTSFFSAMKLSGGLIFYKDEKGAKQYDLLLGAFYNAFNGFAFPLPFVKYHKIIDNHWSYDLGFPKLNLEYTFNPKHTLKAYATIDGFNSNLVESVTITNGIIEKFNVRVLVAGFKYDYTIRRHLEFYFASGYILNSTINFRDNNADDLVRLNGDNAIYLRTGIRLKI